MKKSKRFFNKLFIIAFVLLAGCILFIVSCKDDGILNDREVIEELITGFSDFNDVKNNAQKAINYFENTSIDPEPILICATLSDVSEESRLKVFLLTYEEDGDLSGIKIKERFSNTNSDEIIIEEDYPVFTMWRPSKGAIPIIIFFQKRKSGQLKSEDEWEKYIDGISVEKDKITNVYYWVQTLPQVFISVPEPNKVEVEIYLYDKAGHKSKPVILRNVEAGN